MPTSWKTTVGGVLSLLGGAVGIGNMILAGQIDPVQFSIAMTAIGAGWTGLTAKDHNVSNSPTPVAAKPV
jgi:hypothetical protein